MSKSSYDIVVVGDRTEALQLIRKLQHVYSPRTVFVLKDPSAAEKLSSIATYTELLTAQGGKATAYVCQNYMCELPTTDVEAALASLIRANAR